MPKLPESFTIPTGSDYDNLVDALHTDITEEGGANFYLGAVRYERRNHQSFYMKTLRPMAKIALGMEAMQVDKKVTIDPEHKIANAAVSGMLFGNAMNEVTYPSFNQKLQPYHNLFVYTNLMGEQKDAYIAHNKIATLKGRRIGYRAMSNFIVGQLSDASLLKVDSWSESLIPNPDYRPYFLQGVGMSLFAAWDVYTDLMVEDGREDEVKLLDDLEQDR